MQSDMKTHTVRLLIVTRALGCIATPSAATSTLDDESYLPEPYVLSNAP